MAFPPDSNRPMELILLGTGSSAAVPDIACVTDRSRGCVTCLSAIDGTTEGAKNVRANTGALLRIPQEDGEELTILIDCGKTFRETAIKHFPKKGLRRIDACVLTHHHADAIDGLDDLRAWTYKDAIERTIPIYCSRTTFGFIKSGFPYMVDKAAASGSGAIPSFDWRVFDDDEDEIVIFGVKITPVPVLHGQFFTQPPKPLFSLGLLIDASLLYCSDVSFIPESSWERIAKEISLPDQNGNYSNTNLPKLKALVIDCTGLKLSKSHFGLAQSLMTARRLGVKKTYLTDLPHGCSHKCWFHCCVQFMSKDSRASRSESNSNSSRAATTTQAPPAAKLWRYTKANETQDGNSNVYGGFDPLDEDFHLFTEKAFQAVENWAGGSGPAIWVRPAVDGMMISWQGKRSWDDEYL